jgi:hypothetical protein
MAQTADTTTSTDDPNCRDAMSRQFDECSYLIERNLRTRTATTEIAEIISVYAETERGRDG